MLKGFVAVNLTLSIMSQCCYPDKRSPRLVSVGLSQPDAHREALHTCHLPRHPASGSNI